MSSDLDFKRRFSVCVLELHTRTIIVKAETKEEAEELAFSKDEIRKYENREGSAIQAIKVEFFEETDYDRDIEEMDVYPRESGGGI